MKTTIAIDMKKVFVEAEKIFDILTKETSSPIEGYIVLMILYEFFKDTIKEDFPKIEQESKDIKGEIRKIIKETKMEE